MTHLDALPLHEGWTLTTTAGPVPDHIQGRVVPATVPGSAHTDLLAAGLIEDPFLGRNETELVWAHRTHWRFATRFVTAPPADDERVDLTFDGLDTVAAVTLDGTELGRTANQHRSYRFDVRTLLAAGGEHELTVDFSPALEHAEQVEARLGFRPRPYPHPFNAVRKMACSFGWDWGPDFQTAGIWKPVRLERWRTARLASVRPLVTVADDGSGRVELHADLERAGLGDDDVALRSTVPPSIVCATCRLRAICSSTSSATIWARSRLISCSRFSDCMSSSLLMPDICSHASFVGANTVYSVLPVRESSMPAALTASTKVLRSSFSSAI